MISIQHRQSDKGGALVVVVILLFLMSVSLLAIHSYTDEVGRETGRSGEYLRTNAAAGA